MARIQLTEQLARAAATDAGNAHARRHDRHAWNEDDYNAAVAEFDRLIPHLPDEARLRLTGTLEN